MAHGINYRLWTRCVIWATWWVIDVTIQIYVQVFVFDMYRHCFTVTSSWSMVDCRCSSSQTVEFLFFFGIALHILIICVCKSVKYFRLQLQLVVRGCCTYSVMTHRSKNDGNRTHEARSEEQGTAAATQGGMIYCFITWEQRPSD